MKFHSKDDTNQNISSLKLRINTVSEVDPSFEIQIFKTCLAPFFIVHSQESNKMIYEVSLDAALVVFENESQRQASEKKLNNSNESRGPLKYAFFSIIL